MNAPYIPGGLRSKLTRRLSRLVARRQFPVALDHSIVTFTFDDFPKSAATAAAAALETHGWAGTFYACAAYAGGETHHGPMFDAGDLHRLAMAGHEIACHTYEHLDCGRASANEVLASIKKNARALAAMGFDRELTNFAFPFGEVTPAVKQVLDLHFDALRGIHPGINRGQCDLNLLSAIPLDGGETGIQRACEAAESLPTAPGWLIYYGHDVQDNPTQWGCTPAQFDAVIKAVEASGAEVLTMDAALGRLAEPPV